MGFMPNVPTFRGTVLEIRKQWRAANHLHFSIHQPLQAAR